MFNVKWLVCFNAQTGGSLEHMASEVRLQRWKMINDMCVGSRARWGLKQCHRGGGSEKMHNGQCFPCLTTRVVFAEMITTYIICDTNNCRPTPHPAAHK